MRLPLICAVIAGLSAPALAASAHAAEQTILPGLWESRNSVSFPVNEDSTSRQCVTPAKIDQFLTGPSSRHYSCVYTHARVSGGTMEAAGHCVDKNGLESTIAVHGSYEPTHFKLKADLTVNLGGLPIPVHASTEADRVAAVCPTGG